MTTIEAIVAELRNLPPDSLEQVAEYVHQLRDQDREERLAVLRKTAGMLTAEEADEWMRAIEECERIDESSW